MGFNSSMMMRPAAPDDSPAIAEIWHAGWRDAISATCRWGLAAARTASSFRTRAADRIGETTVAYAAAIETGPIDVPVRRYVKAL